MYDKKEIRKPFEKKVWLASPTMHGEEIQYITEAYETNWMSTVVSENEHFPQDRLYHGICKYT